jgi:Flp pilus assembly protein protease CpaA
MTLNRNLILALTLTGGAVIAAILAVRRRDRRLEAVQHQTELQTWEGEGGGSVLREVVARRPDLQQARPSEVSSSL